MIYADYAYYTNTYKGTSISQDAFAALSRRASAFIDRLTYNRLNNGYAVTDAVKMAVCAVVDVLKEYEDARQEALTAAGVKSENTDGYSISYQNADDIRATVESAMLEAAQPYLIYTGLMDRSIGGCCRC